MTTKIHGTDEQRAKLFDALRTAQSNMEGVTKASRNPHFKSKYADLAAVIEATVPPMNEAGLAVLQLPSMDEEGVTLTTIIGDASTGAYVESTARAPAVKSNPQGVGSTITYLRRYALQAAAALPAVDDDGNAGSQTQRERRQPPAGGHGRGGAQEGRSTPPRPSNAPLRGAGGKHPSWTEDRQRFIGSLKALGGEYDSVAAWLESRGSGRPSEWDSERRGQFLTHFPSLKDQWLAWSEGAQDG